MGLLSPALVLGAVLSTAYAALFHLWQRGDLQALRRYLLAAWLGFAAGQLLSEMAGIHWLRVGHLSVLSGTIGAAVALMIAKRLEA
jgi:uncharacterized membrane protein YeaQ/YmgE (transglycosylase-associated protein family)